MVATTRADIEASANSLVPNHAYSLLEVKQINCKIVFIVVGED